MAATLTQSADTPDSLDLHDLRELMESVTETASRLQATHASLQNQVSRLQQELAEANAALKRSHALAALGEMAAGIAHEVRNPLASIQLYVQILAEDLVDRPEQAAICAKINRAVLGLDSIVHDVLAFARESRIDPQATTAEDIFDRSVASCASLIDDQTQLVRPKSGHHRLYADPGLIVQALSNIIRNAIEAMNESSSPNRMLQLDVASRRMRCVGGKLETRIVMAVQDTGPGIPAAVRERIFNPFFTTRKTGTGLGLAIVHRIVDAHGGYINIENVPGGGARFEVCLPPKPHITSAPSPAHGESRLVLTEIGA